MIKRLLCFLVLLLAGNLAYADILSHPVEPEYIINVIPVLNSISCKFEQEKTIPNSNTVLKSGGDFQFIKGKGVIFKIDYPVKSIAEFSSSQNKQIGDIIDGIANQDYSYVKNSFNLFFEGNKNNWKMALVPKETNRIVKHLDNIKIDGNNHIEKIIIKTRNSGITTIYFHY